MIRRDTRLTHKVLPAAIVVFTATALTGCAEVDSDTVRTTGFHANIDVEVGDTTTGVSVDLATGSAIDSDSIVLTYGDRLRATLGGYTQTLVRQDQHYFANFNDATPGQTVIVSLERQNDFSAMNSTVPLPERIEITAPGPGERYYAGEAITLAWSPNQPGEQVEISFEGKCTNANGRLRPVYVSSINTPDTGIYSIPVNSIVNHHRSETPLAPGVPCSIAITLTRVSFGVLDAAYGRGGSISAIREKRIGVTVIP